MYNSYCLDEKTLDLNVSDELEVQYDTEFFDNTADGLAYKNHIGYYRTFHPQLYSDNTPITMGASTITGTFTKARARSNALTYGTAEPLDICVCHFNIVLTLGAGFSIPAGTLNWRQSSAPYIMSGDTVLFNSSSVGVVPGLFGVAHLRDVSANADRFYNVYEDFDLILGGTIGGPVMATETGTLATNSAPWTWATGDIISVEGTCFPQELAVDPLR